MIKKNGKKRLCLLLILSIILMSSNVYSHSERMDLSVENIEFFKSYYLAIKKTNTTQLQDNETILPTETNENIIKTKTSPENTQQNSNTIVTDVVSVLLGIGASLGGYWVYKKNKKM